MGAEYVRFRSAQARLGRADAALPRGFSEAMSVRRLPVLSPRDSVDDVCAALDEDGGVIVEGLAQSDLISAIWVDLEPHLAQTPYGADDFVGTQTRRVNGMFGKSLHYADLLCEPLFLESSRRWLAKTGTIQMGEETVTVTPSVQVSVAQAIQIWPGETAQPLHRDDILHYRRHPGPDSQIQVLYAGTDFTAANGGTMVVPGSHKWDDDRQPLLEEAIATEMPAGSGLIYLGSTYHGGGTNVSDRPRTAFNIALLLGYLRQEENQYLAVPVDVVSQYPEDVRRLLGWEACPPFCGWWELDQPYLVLERQGAPSAARDMF